MDKKKIIYIGILLIVTVLISVTYFSYAFFTSRIEQHGKLNIVAGTLDYQIASNDLVNNSIVLESNESKTINIKITSLNDINSKYELYYTSNNNIEIGYDSNNDTPTGIINKIESKNIIVTIKNKNSNSTTVTFGVEGGLISNNLVLSIGNSITENINNNCLYESGYVWNFPFDPDGDGKGQEQVFTVPCDGNYKLEVWGAQGGNTGGLGGYSYGNVNLTNMTDVYVVVGGTTTSRTGGYNGGGTGGYSSRSTGYGGGGATHIALSSGLLSVLSENKESVLIVAGGGGAKGTNQNGYTGGAGGIGGGLTSGAGSNAGGGNRNGSAQYTYGAGAANQTTGSNGGRYGCGYNSCGSKGGTGTFGLGGDGGNGANPCSQYPGGSGGAGGGGYYGGGGGGGGAGNSYCASGGTTDWTTAGAGGAGGSGYIGGVSNGETRAGNQSMATHDGTGTMIGNSGNGHARITYLGN